MTEYSLSSCNCYDCKPSDFTPTGVPTNMSVRNCDFNPYSCGNKFMFKSGQEPSNNTGYSNMNPEIYTQSYDKSFQKINCSDSYSNCKRVFASHDPRLISAAHSGQILTLDRPPITSEIKLKDIYTDQTLKKYGQNYKTYSDINAGQISYYIDKSIQNAFFKPNFTSEAEMYGTIYKDPMGAMKPQYDRQAKYQNPLNTENKNYEGGLSWIQDSQNHRQDLLALQMRKQNEQRWEPRWT